MSEAWGPGHASPGNEDQRMMAAGGSVRTEFERMNKPREIEEFLDTYGWRRLGYLLVKLLRPTRVTPNMISAAGVAAAFASAWAYYYRDLTGALLEVNTGAGTVVWSS